MKKKLESIGEFLWRVFVFGFIGFFILSTALEYEGKPGYYIFILWGTVIISVLFYLLFIHEIIAKSQKRYQEEKKEIEEFAYREKLKEGRKKQRKEKNKK